MKWYKNRPDLGDYVVVTITDVDQNSVYAELDEYDGISGLIHISEIARDWVQDASDEIEESEKTVVQVIEDEGDTMDLSLKRVNEKQKRETMEKWNKEQKAEEFLEDLSEKSGEDKEDLYEKVVFPLQKEFGTSFHGFELAVGKKEKMEEMFGEEIAGALAEVAEENINLRQEKLEVEIEVEYPQGDGIDRIRDTFKDMEAVEVKYVSAPKYAITAWGRNQELAKKRMDRAVEEFREKAGELGGDFEFSKA
ncbi:MAG: S1 RNA-binding domain-containing protein [Candidatus Nanohaloarchaea archaeon]